MQARRVMLLDHEAQPLGGRDFAGAPRLCGLREVTLGLVIRKLRVVVRG